MVCKTISSVKCKLPRDRRNANDEAQAGRREDPILSSQEELQTNNNITAYLASSVAWLASFSPCCEEVCERRRRRGVPGAGSGLGQGRWCHSSLPYWLVESGGVAGGVHWVVWLAL